MQKILVLLVSLFSIHAFANVCGSDYQNFNPITSGIDFITVQPSETLSPCLGNLGVFFDYAQNTLTYANNQSQSGKVQDSMNHLDLSLGLGLAPNWDFGVSLPFILGSRVKDATYADYLSKDGLSEVRVNTKIKVWGDSHGGVALAGTLNFNTIQDNPYVGTSSQPILGVDLIGDHSWGDLAVALNLGYRARKGGDSIAGVPITPYGNQYTYSVAGSYWIDGIDSKFVTEIYGAQPVSQSSTVYESQKSLEAIVGLKHEYSQKFSIHMGLGSAVQAGTASPDMRLYAGINYAFDNPFCAKKTPAQEIEKIEIAHPANNVVFVENLAVKNDPPPPAPAPAPHVPKELVKLSAEVLFDSSSDKIKPEAFAHLDNIAKMISQVEYTKVEIQGHTDSIGKHEFNLALSRKRAEAVKNYLVETKHLDAKKLEFVGFGDSRPVASNRNQQGRRANRRVDFVIYR